MNRNLFLTVLTANRTLNLQVIFPQFWFPIYMQDVLFLILVWPHKRIKEKQEQESYEDRKYIWIHICPFGPDENYGGFVILPL